MAIFFATERLLVWISDTTRFQLGRLTRVIVKCCVKVLWLESQVLQKCTHPWIVCPTVIWFQCLSQMKTLKSYSLYYYSTKHFLIPEGNHYQPLYVKYSNRSFREQTTLVCGPLVQKRLKRLSVLHCLKTISLAGRAEIIKPCFSRKSIMANVKSDGQA